MSKYLSRVFSGLRPYVPGEQPNDMRYIKLNTNESPFPPSPAVVEAINQAEVGKLNLYPDPSAADLGKAIAEYYQVDAKNVILGNGSDEILAFAFYAYGEKGFTYPEISYGFYPVFAEFFHIPFNTVPLGEDLQIRAQDYHDIKGSIILANPNAQTGLYLDPDKIEGILQRHREDILIIDEAYIDFGGESVIPLTKRYDNLLVVGTFSKSRNLAGGRIGFAIGNQELITDLNTLRNSFNPYNLNRLSLLAGQMAIADRAYFQTCTGEVMRVREYSKECLFERGFTFTDSRANFILARTDKIPGKTLYEKLKAHGVLVRYLGIKGIEDYVRITVGTKEQMDILFTAIDQIFKEGEQ